MGYLDESGFSLTLPPTYAWGRRGEAKGVPRARGSRGWCGGIWAGWPKV